VGRVNGKKNAELTEVKAAPGGLTDTAAKKTGLAEVFQPAAADAASLNTATRRKV